eukprot:m.788292 g.788292  ORF g.788292 m.788292 type:complete len:334 (-) comp59192_c1_seq12:171-1172(-)
MRKLSSITSRHRSKKVSGPSFSVASSVDSIDSSGLIEGTDGSTTDSSCAAVLAIEHSLSSCLMPRRRFLVKVDASLAVIFPGGPDVPGEADVSDFVFDSFGPDVLRSKCGELTGRIMEERPSAGVHAGRARWFGDEEVLTGNNEQMEHTCEDGLQHASRRGKGVDLCAVQDLGAQVVADSTEILLVEHDLANRFLEVVVLVMTLQILNEEIEFLHDAWASFGRRSPFASQLPASKSAIVSVAQSFVALLVLKPQVGMLFKLLSGFLEDKVAGHSRAHEQRDFWLLGPCRVREMDLQLLAARFGRYREATVPRCGQLHVRVFPWVQCECGLGDA